MNLIIKLLGATITLAWMSACTREDNGPAVPPPNGPAPTLTFTATMNGAQETPPNNSTATGSATLVYDTTTKIFTVVVTHTVAAPTNGHIHKGAPGVAGPVIFPFASFTSPISYTSPVLDASQDSTLRANLYYVNIHTAAFPGGEIRGQLIKQ